MGLLDTILSLFGGNKQTAPVAARGHETDHRDEENEDDENLIEVDCSAEKLEAAARQAGGPVKAVKSRRDGQVHFVRLTNVDGDPIDFEDMIEMDAAEVWRREKTLEMAHIKGDKAFREACKKVGVRDWDHWKKIKAYVALTMDMGSDEFMNAGMQATTELAREEMAQSAANIPGLFDPIEGIDLKTYATISARRVHVTSSADFVKLLLGYGIDEVVFAKVEKGWLAKMQNTTDAMATMALTTEYGKHFTAASQGQFAATAQAAAQSLGTGDLAVTNAAEPCTFERYMEIFTANNCWGEQGQDIVFQMKKVFGLSISDFSNLGAYWSLKMNSDMKYHRQMDALEQKYRARYMADHEDPDADLVL